MKKTLLFLTLILLVLNPLRSQIELEFTYPAPNVFRTFFPFAGERYVWRDAQPGVLELYDKNHVLAETLDANIEEAELQYVNFLSEGIFSPDPGIHTIATYQLDNQFQTRILNQDMETVFTGAGPGNLLALRKSDDSYLLNYFVQDGPEFDVEMYSVPDYNLITVVPNVTSPLRRVLLDDGNVIFFTQNNLNQVLLFNEDIEPIGNFQISVEQGELAILGQAYQTIFDDDFLVEFVVIKINTLNGDLTTQVIEQTGSVEFTTDNFLALYGGLDEGFSFYTATNSANPNVFSEYEVYTAKNFVLETTYPADAIISFLGQVLEESGKSNIIMRENPLRIEQYDADHNLVLSVDPEITVTADQTPGLAAASEGLLGTEGLECLINLFGLNDIEATYLVDQEGNPYFSTGFGEFTSPSFFPGVADAKLIGTVFNDPNNQVTNVYSVDVLDQVNEIDFSNIELRLFPNPAVESMQVFLPLGNVGARNEVSYQIHNALGQAVQQGQLATYQETEISLEDIPAGTYFLNFEIGGTRLSRTFVKR